MITTLKRRIRYALFPDSARMHDVVALVDEVAAVGVIEADIARYQGGRARHDSYLGCPAASFATMAELIACGLLPGFGVFDLGPSLKRAVDKGLLVRHPQAPLYMLTHRGARVLNTTNGYHHEL